MVGIFLGGSYNINIQLKTNQGVLCMCVFVSLYVIIYEIKKKKDNS